LNHRPHRTIENVDALADKVKKIVAHAYCVRAEAYIKKG